jgi:DNA-binding response OmpR family regulator
MNRVGLRDIPQQFRASSFIATPNVSNRIKLEDSSCVSNENEPEVLYENLKVRYVSTADAFVNARIDWLNTVIPGCKNYAYADGATHYFSLADDDFDIMIFGGNDAVRSARFLKHGKPILNRRLKILLMTDSLPPRRAQALTAGFDDVFDTSRTKPAEAVARITAMWRRYNDRVRAEHLAFVSRTQIEEVAVFDTLSARERKILEILIGRRESFASYALLQANLSTHHDGITFQHLKVIICELRKKLRPGYKIRSRALLGYEIHEIKK